MTDTDHNVSARRGRRAGLGASLRSKAGGGTARGGTTNSAEEFTPKEAREVCDATGTEWSEVDLEQFRLGLAVELGHGQRDPATDVTGDDQRMTGKIALAHLRETRGYYTRLARMERVAATPRA